MATRPTKIPEFATDDDYTSGDFLGTPTKVEPLTGEKAQGWHPGNRPPAQKFNWILNKLCDWVAYLADVAYLNWYSHVFADQTPAAFNNTFLRPDGTNEAFFTQWTGWVLLGQDTAGSLWIGDYEFYFDVASGVGGAPKVSFGCETNTGRLLLFDHTANGAGSHTSYLRSDQGDATTWALLNLGNVTTDGAACDVVRIDGAGLGRIVVCGGQDGDYVIWKSDDAGFIFTKVDVGTRIDIGNNLHRIIVGKDGLLITWTHAATVNGGATLWYSDDFGDTWASRTGIGFDNIFDAVYLEDEDVYLFMRASDIRRVTDPIAGSFTTLTGPPIAPLSAIASSGSAVLVAGVPNTNVQAMYMSTDQGDTWRKLWVTPTNLIFSKVRHIAVGDDGQMLTWGDSTVRRSLKAGA